MRGSASVSRVLHILNLSTSGYYEFLKREPSRQALHKEEMKKQIQDIYDESHQNYGAPKIAKVLQKEGNTISERTVGTYMREMGIKAQWVKCSASNSISRKRQIFLYTSGRETHFILSGLALFWLQKHFILFLSVQKSRLVKNGF